MKKTKPNVPLLRQIMRLWKAQPKRLRMDEFLRLDVSKEWDAPPCGTVGCIAGWAAVLKEKMNLGKGATLATAALAARNTHCNSSMDYPGQKALNLTDKQTDRLFFLGEWPRKYRKAYDDANTAKDRVRATCARINHFIRTGR